MEPDNNHFFQVLSLAVILLYTFFLSKAKKENLNTKARYK